MTAVAAYLARTFPSSPPRMAPAVAVTVVVEVLLAVALVRADQDGTPAAAVLILAVAAAGLGFGFTRPAPGGVLVADLDTTEPCENMQVAVGEPAAGFLCRGYGYPRKGEFLSTVLLPSGRTARLCPACAAVFGPVLIDVVGIAPAQSRAVEGRLRAANAALEGAEMTSIEFPTAEAARTFWELNRRLHVVGIVEQEALPGEPRSKGAAGTPGSWVAHHSHDGSDRHWVTFPAADLEHAVGLPTTRPAISRQVAS